MTVSKEMATPRPTSAHRLSSASAASSLPSRHSRTHSHSLSVGSINQAHRVTRRKSMTSTPANNVAAMTAAVQGSPGASSLESGATTMRRPSKSNLGTRAPSLGNYPSMPNSLPNNNGHAFGQQQYNGTGARAGSVVTDGPPLAAMPENEKGNTKNRHRRASEGSRLSKGESKRASGSELKCEKCGKGYKHSSCLTKHLWEHTPEWAFTSKLLISKHQQVQLLEAASVLVAMNQEAAESGKDSDHSSASPAASGSSDPREDDLSSTDTTPPPQADEQYAVGSFSTHASQSGRSKRYSGNSSAYSQSYQSASAASVFSDSTSNGQTFMSHFRQWSNDGRPTTSGTSVAGSYFDDEDQADLAAAVGLLSCSYGTPKTGPIMLPPDVPPVPPLPAKFLGQNMDGLSGSTNTLTPHQSSIRTQLSPHLHESKDVRMGDDDDESLVDDDDFNHSPRHRIDEDEGIFGRMEE